MPDYGGYDWPMLRSSNPHHREEEQARIDAVDNASPEGRAFILAQSVRESRLRYAELMAANNKAVEAGRARRPYLSKKSRRGFDRGD